MPENAATSQIDFREVNPSRWLDFEQLFARRGGPKACWCMVWRATPAEARHTDGASRKAALAGRVAAGVPVGIAAVAHAQSHGARVIEAYPVDPDSPGYRFMGFVPVFERAGFSEVGRAGTRRHVMQLKLCG